MRPIDAEWLKAFFEADKGKDRMTPIDSLLALIDDAPTIDAVSVVRCKDTADALQTRCETCEHYKLTCEVFSEICKYEPRMEREGE